MTHDDLEVARLGILAALREGDAGMAFRLVVSLLDDGLGLPHIVDHVLAPIQGESGRRWVLGDASISEEHAATAAMETLVALLAGAFEPLPDAELVVTACVEGDQHSLPPRLAGALLAYEGRRSVFLGSSVPATDLGAYLSSLDVTAAVLSCARPSTLLGARASVAAAHDAGVPVVVGGRAFDPDGRRARAVGADAVAARLSEVGELLDRWSPAPTSAEAAALPVPPEVRTLADSAGAVAAPLVDALAAGRPTGVGGPDVVAALHELVDVVAVAWWLDEPALVADHIGWIGELAVGRHDVRLRRGDVFDALAAEVGVVAAGAVATVTAAASA